MAKALYGTIDASLRRIKKCFGVIDGKYAAIKTMYGVVDGTYKSVSGNQTLIFATFAQYKADASASLQYYSEAYTSTNGGASWTSTLFRPGYKIGELKWVHDRFFMTMTAYPTWDTRKILFYSSFDGISWTLCHEHTTSSSPYLAALFYANGTYIAAVGQSLEFLTSTDGTTWTKVSSANISVPSSRNVVNLMYYQDKYYYFKGQNANPTFTIYYSTDLQAWTLPASSTYFRENYPYSVWDAEVYNDKFLIAFNSSADQNRKSMYGVYSTSDHKTFTRIPVVEVDGYDYSGNVQPSGAVSIGLSPAKDKVYLSGAIAYYSTGHNGLYYSVDGSSWTLEDPNHRGPILWSKGKAIYPITDRGRYDELATTEYTFDARISVGGELTSPIVPQSGHLMGQIYTLYDYKRTFWLASDQEGE